MKYYKTFPILLAVSLLVIGGAKYLFSPASPNDECERVFSSNVYSDYYDQLSVFLNSHPLTEKVKNRKEGALSVQLKKLISVLDEPHQTKDEMRQLHESFVRELRLAAEIQNDDAKKNETESSELFRDLIRWIYLGVYLTPSMEEFLFSYIPTPHGHFPSYLVEMQSRLHGDKGFYGVKYDPEEEDGYLHGNLPSVYATLSTPAKTKLIRAGNPFIYSLKFPWGSPLLSPEFNLFLKNSSGHLYVNLLKRQGTEGKTAKTVENLEKDFPDVFVISLDKNSDFYHQNSKKYSAPMPAESVKELFLAELLSPNGNYYWPSQVENGPWQEELESILDRVQEKYFYDQVELDHSERRDFIELTYLDILDVLVDKLSPASMNFSCHQGMDRGPSLLVLWMYKKSLTNDRETTALLLAPPMLIHNRSSHEGRILRFASALRRLETKRERANSIDGGQRL